MDHSETKNHIIQLGKQLLDSLGKGNDLDSLTRWMCHYLAEQITISETTVGKLKQEAEARCVDTILKIWSHRNDMPAGRRPFEKFDSILGILDRLDSDNLRYFYSPIAWVYGYEEGSPSAKWIDGIRNADQAAKIVIQHFLRFAMAECTDDATRVLLKNSLGEADGVDLAALRSLIERLKVGKETKEQDPTVPIKRQIEDLDRFLLFCGGLRKALSDSIKPQKGKKTIKGKKG